MNSRTAGALDQELAAIIAGEGWYGSCPIADRVLGVLPSIQQGEQGMEVHWVGHDGMSASVGQAVRLLSRLWSYRLPKVRVLVNAGHVGQHLVYYVVEGSEDPFPLSPGLEARRRTTYTTYIVGGCTDFSGEGNHARELMERFFAVRGGLEERGPAYLIGLLASIQGLDRLQVMVGNG